MKRAVWNAARAGGRPVLLICVACLPSRIEQQSHARRSAARRRDPGAGRGRVPRPALARAARAARPRARSLPPQAGAAHPDHRRRGRRPRLHRRRRGPRLPDRHAACPPRPSSWKPRARARCTPPPPPAEIMRRMGLHSVIVVSDGYHIYRVKQMLESRGLKVYGSPRRGAAARHLPRALELREAGHRLRALAARACRCESEADRRRLLMPRADPARPVHRRVQARLRAGDGHQRRRRIHAQGGVDSCSCARCRAARARSTSISSARSASRPARAHGRPAPPRSRRGSPDTTSATGRCSHEADAQQPQQRGVAGQDPEVSVAAGICTSATCSAPARAPAWRLRVPRVPPCQRRALSCSARSSTSSMVPCM